MNITRDFPDFVPGYGGTVVLTKPCRTRLFTSMSHSDGGSMRLYQHTRYVTASCQIIPLQTHIYNKAWQQPIKNTSNDTGNDIYKTGPPCHTTPIPTRMLRIHTPCLPNQLLYLFGVLRSRLFVNITTSPTFDYTCLRGTLNFVIITDTSDPAFTRQPLPRMP